MTHPFVINRIHRLANEMQPQSARSQFTWRIPAQFGLIYGRSMVTEQNLEAFLPLTL